MVLDPDCQRVLDMIRESGRPPYETLSPREARIFYLMSRSVLQPDPPDIGEVRGAIAPGPAGDIPLRLYRGIGTAEDQVLPALVYFHGGGWMIGDLDTHDGVCRALANAARCRVIAVDYRLAPEEKFPAAVDDAAAATRFVFDNAASLRIDPAYIAVGGDSAGGNLAAVTALMARDGDLPRPCLQLLIYPSLDLSSTQDSYQRVVEGFPLTTTTMRWFRNAYIRNEADIADWRASPLRAPHLDGLCPAFVLTAAHDPLCDEAFEYVRRLTGAGVPVSHLHMNDQMHGFLTMGRIVRAAQFATEACAAALQGAWRRN